MVTKEIRLYVEGGGDTADGKARIRQGFGRFLSPIVSRCRDRRVRWTVTACGGRRSAWEHFSDAVRQIPDSSCFLLVDSEDPVSAPPWEHLARREGDLFATDQASRDRYHLMVVVMESWLLADPDALERYYGRGFRRSALPSNKVEALRKQDIESALLRATEQTKKGRYHKIRHGPELLASLDPAVVRRAAPHCERLFATLEEHLKG